MVQVNLLNYFVPDVILCQILSKFLILRDIAHLDTAFCNHIKRSLFLESIRSKNYVWIGDKKKDFFSANGIVWIDLRDIKINHLICKQISKEAAVSISRFGSSLQWLRPYDLNETEPENLGKRIIRILEGCPNLEYLDMNCFCFANIVPDSLILEKLESLELGYDWTSNSDLVKLVNCCPNVKRLNLESCTNLTDEGINTILETCHELVHLNIGYSNITGDTMIKIADYCPKFRDLDISACAQFTDIGLTRVAEGCPSLQRLKLCDYNPYGTTITRNITDSGIVRLAECCPNLQHLEISNEYESEVVDLTNFTDISIVRIAECCPDLLTLNISQEYYKNDNITDVAIIQIAQGCPKLQNLNVSCHNKISDISMLRIADNCPHLMILNASRCENITDVALISIAEGCPSLHTLSLSKCHKLHHRGNRCSCLQNPDNITDVSIIKIAEICTNLQDLDVSYCDGITDESIMRIIEEPFTLKKLNISNCDGITDSFRNTHRKRINNLK